MNAFHAWIELLEVDIQGQLSMEASSLLAQIKVSNHAMASKLATEIHSSIHGAVFGTNRADVMEFLDVMKKHSIRYPTELVSHIINKFTS